MAAHTLTKCHAGAKPAAPARATKTPSPAPAKRGLAMARDILASPGAPLDPTVRSRMEASFGHHMSGRHPSSAPFTTRQELFSLTSAEESSEVEADRVAHGVSRAYHSARAEKNCGFDFGHVRVHTDRKAAASAEAIGAAAYTAGSHIVFAPESFSPGTAEGRWLLAHELTHVVQQTSARNASNQPEEVRAPLVSPFIARKKAYPKLHETVLQKLIAIVRLFPKDEQSRLPALIELAKGIPAADRPLLYERLADPVSQDSFTVYLRNNFPTTQAAFLKALNPEVPSEPGAPAKAEEEPLLPPRTPGEKPAKAGAEFVSSRYSDVQSDPLYLDNFINDINDAWLPNDRKFIFEYPGGIVLEIALRDLIKALQVKSDLNPQPTDEENRKKYKIPDDLQLPMSTSPTPLLAAGNRNDFFRDTESKVIYPTGEPVYKIFLPRISHAVEEIESVRVNQELLQRNLIPILERIIGMEWSAPRGFGSLLVRIGRFARSRKAAGLAGEVAKEAAELEAKARAKPPAPAPHSPEVTAPKKAPVASLAKVDPSTIPKSWRAKPLSLSGGKDVYVYRGFARDAEKNMATVVREGEIGGVLSRRPDAAHDAVFNQVGRDPVLTGAQKAGIVRVRVPAKVWDSLVQSNSISERAGYPGFSHQIESTEIRVNSPEAARVINGLEKEVVPADPFYDFRQNATRPARPQVSPSGDEITLEPGSDTSGDRPTIP